jgi:hypothetical protein
VTIKIDAVVMMSGGRSHTSRPLAAQPIVTGSRGRLTRVTIATASGVRVDSASCRAAGRRRLHSGGGQTMMSDATEMMIINQSTLARLVFAIDPSSCRAAGRRRFHSGGEMTMMIDETGMMTIMRST